MVYEFAAKIKNIQHNNLCEELLKECADEIGKKFDKPMEIKTLLAGEVPYHDILVKAQASVSTMPMFFDAELTETLNKFRQYLDGFSAALGGEISKADAFYNNSKTFNKLYL
ncbi:MAG: hypothetical protein LBS21_06530 [Clostridiales bacterium]|jgi:hypothetical protein|nr:hypothetical protein [Clostridiales bacterium]